MIRPWDLNIELSFENKEVPIYLQLANQVQRLIETGILKNGDLLPGSRQMAEQLHISRKTVVTALELLVFSGWLENRERVGLFVRERKSDVSSAKTPAILSSESIEHPKQDYRLEVNDGYPDTQLVPFEELSRAYRRLFNRAARWKMLGYGDPQGSQKLRNIMTQEVCQERGLSSTPEEMILTRGSQQALYLIAHALFKPGDAVVMETPTYENARLALESAGLEILSVPIDEEGLSVIALEELLASHPNIRAIYTTPRFQYPTTVTLSATRRRQLVQLALDHDVKVIEDDFGYHFQFSTSHIYPLSVLLPQTHYIYIGTFSKILAPALRLGFVVSSADVISRMSDYRKMVDIQGDTVMERAIHDLIESGELKKHLRKSCKIYRERLDTISRLIHHELSGIVQYKKPHGGLALWIEMAFDPTLALQRQGILAHIVRLSDTRFGLRIGYASMQEEEMQLLITALKTSHTPANHPAGNPTPHR